MAVDRPLTEAVARAACTISHTSTPQNISNTAWRFGTLVAADQPLSKAPGMQAVSCGLELQPQDSSNRVWEMANPVH